jgi:hypothetical protein
VDDSGLEMSVCEKYIPYALMQSLFGDLQDQRVVIGEGVAASEEVAIRNTAVKNRSELNIATAGGRKSAMSLDVN